MARASEKTKKQTLRSYGLDELKVVLATRPADILAQREDVRDAQRALTEAEMEISVLEAELSADIASEINRETGKTAFSNETARRAELVVRMNKDPNCRIIQRQFILAKDNYERAKDQVDKLIDELKSYRYIAKIVSAELEYLSSEVEEEETESF